MISLGTSTSPALPDSRGRTPTFASHPHPLWETDLPTRPCEDDVERALETSHTDAAPRSPGRFAGHAAVSVALRQVLSRSRWTERQDRRAEATRRILRPLADRLRDS